MRIILQVPQDWHEWAAISGMLSLKLAQRLHLVGCALEDRLIGTPFFTAIRASAIKGFVALLAQNVFSLGRQEPKCERVMWLPWLFHRQDFTFFFFFDDFLLYLWNFSVEFWAPPGRSESTQHLVVLSFIRGHQIRTMKHMRKHNHPKSSCCDLTGGGNSNLIYLNRSTIVKLICCISAPMTDISRNLLWRHWHDCCCDKLYIFLISFSHVYIAAGGFSVGLQMSIIHVVALYRLVAMISNVSVPFEFILFLKKKYFNFQLNKFKGIRIQHFFSFFFFI